MAGNDSAGSTRFRYPTMDGPITRVRRSGSRTVSRPSIASFAMRWATEYLGRRARRAHPFEARLKVRGAHHAERSRVSSGDTILNFSGVRYGVPGTPVPGTPVPRKPPRPGRPNLRGQRPRPAFLQPPSHPRPVPWEIPPIPQTYGEFCGRIRADSLSGD